MSLASGFALGQYYPADSPIHRMDPRVKLLLVVLFSVAVFVIDNFITFGAILLLLVMLAKFGRLPLLLLARAMRPLFYILIFTFLIHIFSGGPPWAQVGPIDISVAGLRLGALLVVRLTVLVIGASFLTLTSTPVELTDAIEYVLSPLQKIKVPAHELAMMMSIALRFIPTLSIEAGKIVRAQAARGAHFEARNPVARARSFIPVLVPLFVSVFRRADDLAEALESRAYRGGKGRTRMRELKARPSDFAYLAASFLLLAVLVWLGNQPFF